MLSFDPISVNRLPFEDGVKNLTTSSNFCIVQNKTMQKNNIMSIFGGWGQFLHGKNDLHTHDAKKIDMSVHAKNWRSVRNSRDSAIVSEFYRAWEFVLGVM